MPISSENKLRYPADWKAISLRIRKERARDRCECRGECGVAHRSVTQSVRCGPFARVAKERMECSLFKSRRGPNGRRLCYGCGSEVPPGRRTWCGSGCVDRYREQADQNGWARAVVKRWGRAGRCGQCGCDPRRITRIAKAARRLDQACWRSVKAWLRDAGWIDGRESRPYEADHTVGLADGGEHVVENGRVLCVPCHKAETAREAADRSRCRARNGQPHPVTESTVVLTVAHLDHQPENNDESNLRAMCQACHLAYDRHHHAATARATRVKRRAEADADQGQGVLF